MCQWRQRFLMEELLSVKMLKKGRKGECTLHIALKVVFIYEESICIAVNLAPENSGVKFHECM